MHRPIPLDSVAFEGAVDGLRAIVPAEADDCPTEGPTEDSILPKQRHRIDEEAWILRLSDWVI
jgi:hypothetical protein